MQKITAVEKNLLLIKPIIGRGRLAQWKTVRFVKFIRGDRGSIPAKDYFSDMN